MKNVRIELYKTKKIINDHKHSDKGWFWARYSAYPYKGCAHGCRYCYEWDQKYAPHKDYRLLDKVVIIKENAAERLKRELPRKPKDVIVSGDWQPVEARYRLSRKMLEIIRQLGFPLMIVERAPLLARDLDILTDISAQTDCYVGFSIVTVRDDDVRRLFEPRGPSTKGRFKAMKRIADAGVMIGTLGMPVLPYIFDSDEELRGLVRRTADSGGRFVLFGGMTLWGTCKEIYYQALQGYDKSLIPAMEEWDKVKAKKTQWVRRCHLTIAEECYKVGITHYIPRPVSFYPENLRRNKRIAGMLYVKGRDLEMEGQSRYRARAYFKAGETLDNLDKDIGEIYRRKGRDGLLGLPGVGEKLTREIEALWDEEITQK